MSVLQAPRAVKPHSVQWKRFAVSMSGDQRSAARMEGRTAVAPLPPLFGDRARHLGLKVRSLMVIGVLLTMAPLVFLTSNLPLSLFTFACLTIFLPFLVSWSWTMMPVILGGTLTTAAANVIRRRAMPDADGSRPSLRALARTVRRTWPVHTVVVSGQVSRTAHPPLA